MPASLEEALDCLEEDHEFLLKGDVFTPDAIDCSRHRTKASTSHSRAFASRTGDAACRMPTFSLWPGKRADFADRIAVARPLDLDDLGPEAREGHGEEGSGEEHRHRKHADIAQRFHGMPVVGGEGPSAR